MGGILGHLLINKLSDYVDSKKMKGIEKKIIEISIAYLQYVSDHPEDYDEDLNKEIESLVEKII